MAAVGDVPSIDVQSALRRVLKSALISDGLSRGLHEAAKALDKREAHFCVFATACDEPAYEKLVRALCKEHKIPIYEIESKSELGEMVGQCKFDKEGKARKVVGCSCAVVKDFGRDEEAKKVILDYFAAHRD
uniref:40S ribosomal protein S12 n=1 Tax=Acrobeloides nanus TaxID=290746 RepID=A0A914D0B7_9BILA